MNHSKKLRRATNRVLEVFRAVLAGDAAGTKRGSQLLMHRLLWCCAGVLELSSNQVRLRIHTLCLMPSTRQPLNREISDQQEIRSINAPLDPSLLDFSRPRAQRY